MLLEVTDNLLNVLLMEVSNQTFRIQIDDGVSDLCDLTINPICLAPKFWAIPD